MKKILASSNSVMLLKRTFDYLFSQMDNNFVNMSCQTEQGALEFKMSQLELEFKDKTKYWKQKT